MFAKVRARPPTLHSFVNRNVRQPTNTTCVTQLPVKSNQTTFRMYSRDKRWKAPHLFEGTPQAHFPWETYINGEHIFLNAEVLKPNPVAKKEDQTTGEVDLASLGLSPPSITKNFTISKNNNSPPLMSDDSAVVHVAKPKDHVEDTERAQDLRLQQLFWKKNRPDDFASSVFTVRFTPELVLRSVTQVTEGRELEQYLDIIKQNFFTLQPQGSIYKVEISPESTKQLTELNLPFEAYIFDARLSSQATSHAQMALIMKTPGGFWEFAWLAKPSHLYIKNQPFLEMMRSVSVQLKEPAAIKQEKNLKTETSAQETHAALPEPQSSSHSESSASA